MPRSPDVIEEVRRLDPIDADRLTASWSQSAAKHHLLHQLTAVPVAAAAPRRVARRGTTRSRLAVAAGLAAVAFAFVIVTGVLPQTGTSAYAIRQLPDGMIELNVSENFRDGNALADDLREYGVEVDIVTVPASPSRVGNVNVYDQTGGEYIPKGLTIGKDGSADALSMTIDPMVFEERLTIEMAVAAREGEPYGSAEEVFEPGEVLGGLHCALGEPVRAKAVVPYLNKLGTRAVWSVVAPTDDPSVTDSTEVDEVPDGEIVSGYAVDSSTVALNVRPDGVALPAVVQPRLSDVPCTPDQAKAWR